MHAPCIKWKQWVIFLQEEKMQGFMDILISINYNRLYKVNQFHWSVLIPNKMNEIPNVVGNTFMVSSYMLSFKNFSCWDFLIMEWIYHSGPHLSYWALGWIVILGWTIIQDWICHSKNNLLNLSLWS